MLMDVLHAKDIIRLKNNTIYYFKFDERRKVFNACAVVALFRKKTGSKIVAHRDYDNQVVKVEVDTIVFVKK